MNDKFDDFIIGPQADELTDEEPVSVQTDGDLRKRYDEEFRKNSDEMYRQWSDELIRERMDRNMQKQENNRRLPYVSDDIDDVYDDFDYGD